MTVFKGTDVSSMDAIFLLLEVCITTQWCSKEHFSLDKQGRWTDRQKTDREVIPMYQPVNMGDTKSRLPKQMLTEYCNSLFTVKFLLLFCGDTDLPVICFITISQIPIALLIHLFNIYL